MKKIFRLVGKDLDVSAAAIDEVETPVQTDKNDGPIIGVSIAENYDRVDLAKMLLTVNVNGDKPFYDVPLTQLLPEYNGGMFELEKPIAPGLTWNCTLDIRTDQTAVANPVVLIFHHSKQ